MDTSKSSTEEEAKAKAAIAWAKAAIAWAITSIVWAIAVYLMEREKQRAQVEIARLELQTKSAVRSGPSD